ncbi:MAG: hypothetical protein OER43_01005 [Gammaproteobacteria bacterium]|nr:hypothetical protein [Gammaproteobacteria bacterium]MDH3411074.1 hypothetical protein [Gammaproteobacteria bacterium]
MNARLAPVAVVALLLAAGSVALAEPGNRITLRHDPFTRPNFDAPPPASLVRSAGNAPETGKGPPVNMELRGIVIADGSAMVDVNGKLMSVNDSYEGYRLIKIEERKAVFIRNGTTLDLVLAAGGSKEGAGPEGEAARPAPETPVILKSEQLYDEPAQALQK